MIAQDPSIKETAGYDTFGRSKNSLDVKNTGYVTTTEFAANNQGNAVTNYNVRNISADKISAGTIVVSMGIGGPNITIDGSAQQILVNDGTTNRILIGYGSALF